MYSIPVQRKKHYSGEAVLDVLDTHLPFYAHMRSRMLLVADCAMRIYIVAAIRIMCVLATAAMSHGRGRAADSALSSLIAPATATTQMGPKSKEQSESASEWSN